MSSWSCPHLDEKDEYCRRLKTDCVPGRGGCVLPKNLRFAVSPEERIAKLKARRKPNTKPTRAATMGRIEARSLKSIYDADFVQS